MSCERRTLPAMAMAAAAALLGSIAAAPEARAVDWTLRGDLLGAYTSNALPGNPLSTPDRFGTLLLDAGMRARPLPGLRVDWLAGAQADRFVRWTSRDEERYETELRLHSGSWRARARGRVTPHTLLFEDDLGGALYRDREGLLALEFRPVEGLLTGLELRSESQRYDDAHSERTNLRTRWGYVLGWEPAQAGPRVQAAFDNEHGRAQDSNYDFYRNILTLAADLPAGPISAHLETSQGVRNYFPSSLFATNYRRHDREQAYRVDLRHGWGAVELGLQDEFRVRGSTRADRDFHQNTVGLALHWRSTR